MRRTAGAILLIAMAWGLVGPLLGCGPEKRPEQSRDQLLAARRADDAARAAELRELQRGLMARIRSKVDAYQASTQPTTARTNAPAAGNMTAAAGATTGPTTRPTVDLLVISGGGDWGAFGAGVLKGWGNVQGDMARPQFDVVTGVSTGALIAPFAFLGDDASIERVVHLYRNPKEDWAKSRGILFFWPTNPSFYKLPGLEREVKREVNDETLRRIAAEDGTGRCLLVNTSNVDLGDMHAWDIVGESRKALAANDPGRVRSILLASAGIPGIFPSRGIDQWMYVDGAITGNILYGGHVKEEQTVVAQWQAKYPNDPLPRLRYWVIFNNQLRFPPQVTQRKWPAIISRATIMATQDATVNSMRHLYALAEITRMKRNADIEVRVMCIPDDWVPPNDRVFDKAVMNNLADLGERMGANPDCWLTESP